jgi:hypothetical protein
MDPDVYNFFGVACIIIGSLGALSFIGTWTLRSLHRAKQPAALPQNNYDERFSQLQHSVDAIAVEVERIAEAQRFTTRMLTEGTRTLSLTERR